MEKMASEWHLQEKYNIRNRLSTIKQVLRIIINIQQSLGQKDGILACRQDLCQRTRSLH